MTVSELIHELQKYDPDATVWVSSEKDMPGKADTVTEVKPATREPYVLISE